MAKTDRKVARTHVYGSIVIVLAGIFSMIGLLLNSGFVVSEYPAVVFDESGSIGSLAGHASAPPDTYSQADSGTFECAYDGYGGVLICGPSLDDRRFDNSLTVQYDSITGIGVHYGGTRISYEGNYIVLACIEAWNGCTAGYEDACQISKLCPKV